MKRLHLIVWLCCLANCTQLGAEEDWLGSREGLVQGKKVDAFLNSLNHSHHVTRVTVRFKRRKAGMEMSSEYGKWDVWREVTTDDKALCRAAEFGVSDSRWRRHTKNPSGFGWIPMGEVILETSQGKCRILMDPNFILDDGPGCYDSNHQFESWSLTKVVDELLKKDGGEGLSEEHFAHFSGEAYLKHNKEVFERIMSSSTKAEK